MTVVIVRIPEVTSYSPLRVERCEGLLEVLSILFLLSLALPAFLPVNPVMQVHQAAEHHPISYELNPNKATPPDCRLSLEEDRSAHLPN
jgi:hypothetical protein